MIALVLAMTVFAGVGIFRAVRADRADRPRTPYHLYHGPNSGCPDCSDK